MLFKYCKIYKSVSRNGIYMGENKRVSNWQNGNQILRLITSGFMIAEDKFRIIKGYVKSGYNVNVRLREDDELLADSAAPLF